MKSIKLSESMAWSVCFLSQLGETGNPLSASISPWCRNSASTLSLHCLCVGQGLAGLEMSAACNRQLKITARVESESSEADWNTGAGAEAEEGREEEEEAATAAGGGRAMEDMCVTTACT